MNTPNNNLRTKIWDLGPKVPVVPVKPVMPTNLKPGSADEVVAESDFRSAFMRYEQDREAFAGQQRDYNRWQKLYEGPYQIEMWTVNAREAMARDPERYVTKLPKNVKAGSYQAQQEQRRVEEAAELEAVRAMDPQFGSRGVAA